MEPPSPPSTNASLPPLPHSNDAAGPGSTPPINTFHLSRNIASSSTPTDLVIQTFDDRILVIITQNQKIGILVSPHFCFTIASPPDKVDPSFNPPSYAITSPPSSILRRDGHPQPPPTSTRTITHSPPRLAATGRTSALRSVRLAGRYSHLVDFERDFEFQETGSSGSCSGQDGG
jgi:hypothetical protein